MHSLRRSKSDQSMKKLSKRKHQAARNEQKLNEEAKPNGTANTEAEPKPDPPAPETKNESTTPVTPTNETPAEPTAPTLPPPPPAPETPIEDDNKNKAAEEDKEAVDLQFVMDKLETFAPLSLAEDGDNVGLLVEPSSPHKIRRVMLTTEVTEEVLDEALGKGAQFIVSYNSPITEALQRLSSKTAAERTIVKALEKRIAIYTPHTAWESVKGGVNDWLGSAFGAKDDSIPIQPCFVTGENNYRIEVVVGKSNKSDMQEIFKESKAAHARYEKTHHGTYCFSAVCSKQILATILSAVDKKNLGNCVQITELWKEPIAQSGLGRFVNLDNALSVNECIKNVKAHLGVEQVQVAIGRERSMDSLIESVAVCAGDGSKVLREADAGLFVTGTMSHQDIVSAVNRGVTVVTCCASTTERGFLSVAKKKLESQFDDKVEVLLSQQDKNPLKMV